jgi:hypothetical protein
MIGQPRDHFEVKLAGPFPRLIPICSMRAYGGDNRIRREPRSDGVRPRNSIAQPAVRNGNQQHQWLGRHNRLARAASYEFERYLPFESLVAIIGIFFKPAWST